MRRAGMLAILMLTAALFAVPSAAFSEESRADTLAEDVEELKRQNEEMKNRLDAIEADSEEARASYSGLSRLVDVSGYADVEYTFTGKENTSNGFRIHHLSLFFTKDLQKEWKLFSEVEFEDAPRISSDPATGTVSNSQGTLFIEQMYVEYHPTLDWDLRLGRLLTPAGIWSIYHYPPYVPTQTHPLFYKVIFPEFNDGAQLRNTFYIKDTGVDTHLYAGNGSGNPGALDRNQNKGVGARVNAEVATGLSAGASYYREKDNLDAFKNSYALHLLYNPGPLKLQMEYAVRDNRPVNAASFNDSGWYLLASYDIGKWTVAGRYDYYDPNGTVSSDEESRYTGALNYHYAHNVSGKMEYNSYQFKDPSRKEYDELILAIVIAIGDL